MSIVDLSSKNLTDANNIFYSLDNPSQITYLNLSNNNITSIPPDLSHLSNLQKLDLLNNQLEDYEKIGHSLSTLPKLTELSIDLNTQENAFLIISQMPNLLILNGKSTKDDDEEDENNNIVDLNENEIDKASLKNEIPNFNSVTNRITQILNQRGETTDEFYIEFQNVLKTQIECINSLSSNIPNYIYSSYIQQSKVEIYSYLQNKILNMINSKVDYTLINLLNEVNQYIKKILIETIQITRNIYPKFEQIEQIHKNEIDQRDIKINELTIQIELLKNSNNKNNNNSNNLKDNNIKKISNSQRITQKENNNTNPFSNSNFSVSYNNDYYNEEAQKIINNLKSSSKKKTNNNNNTYNSTNNNVKNYNYTTNNSSKKKNSNISLINKSNNNILIDVSLSYQPSTSNLSQYSNITNANQKDLKTVIGPVSKKNFSIQSLLEIIYDIYASKAKNQQKLTMEQYMYFYLNRKYGLKNLVIENAGCIIQGIKEYAKKNSEILLFAKILRNEIEEQEILIVNKLKETISEFLTFYYQNKFQYKSKVEIEQLVNKCKNGILIEEQWTDIVSFLFSENSNDFNNLINKIQKYIDKQNLIGNNKKYGNSLSYNKFIQLVIDYQIKIRSIYLQNFNKLFKSVDNDKDGIINEFEFSRLVELGNVFNSREELEEKTKSMIKQLTSGGNKGIIYNDVVDMFNKEMTFDVETKTKLTILDKLSMD